MSKFDQQLNALFGNIDTKIDEAPQVIAETAVEHFQNALQQKQWDGKPYVPYKHKNREPTRGSLMQRDLNLFNSIKPSMVTATRIVISAGGQRAPYARRHNEGARIRDIRNVRPHHRENFMGKGKRVQIKSYSYKIDYLLPQRQFMGKSPSLLNDIKTRLIANFNTK